MMEPHDSLHPMTPADWPGVREVYLAGLATEQASFQTEAPSWLEWDSTHLTVPRLVARTTDRTEVVGWAALSAVSSRACYRGVAEVSVYVAAAARGRGLRWLLLGELVTESESAGIWMLQAGVFPENAASLRLHERAGFRVVGPRERIEQHHGRWRDTLLLERRSRLVGIDGASRP